VILPKSSPLVAKAVTLVADAGQFLTEAVRFVVESPPLVADAGQLVAKAVPFVAELGACLTSVRLCLA
jgi:hypothetical protein